MPATDLTAAEVMAVYVDALNDPAQRGRLREVLADDLVFEGPVFESYGLDAFLAAVEPWLAALPVGTREVVEGEVPEHHRRFLARYSYVCGRRQVGAGFLVGERREDGLVTRLTGFLDDGSSLPDQRDLG